MKVVFYRKVSFILDEADEGKCLMLSYPSACLCIKNFYYKRSCQAPYYKAHWRGDRIQESNCHRVLSTVLCCLFHYLSGAKKLICGLIMNVCPALSSNISKDPLLKVEFFVPVHEKQIPSSAHQ